jgi:hypothetical protein
MTRPSMCPKQCSVTHCCRCSKLRLNVTSVNQCTANSSMIDEEAPLSKPQITNWLEVWLLELPYFAAGACGIAFVEYTSCMRGENRQGVLVATSRTAPPAGPIWLVNIVWAAKQFCTKLFAFAALLSLPPRSSLLCT